MSSKKIIAVNGSPRISFNTAQLVKEAARAAQESGAEVKYFDLYRIAPFMGCRSCFACKQKPNEGKCIWNDGLKEVLEAIREADGLILGTPNYLGDVSAGFRSFYERLIFQSLTYQKEKQSYNDRKIPVLFIMTSNAPKELYLPIGYSKMIKGYEQSLENFVGNTKVMITGNTMQVNDYSRFNWTMFDGEAKQSAMKPSFPKS